MLFTKEDIEKKALEVYKAAIKNPRISDDICSDLYFKFIEKMTAYGRKHRDQEKAGPPLIALKVCALVRELTRREKRKEAQAEHIITTEECSYNIDCRSDEEAYKSNTLEKLSAFISLAPEWKKTFKEYSVIFLLYYCVYLPMDFILITMERFSLQPKLKPKDLELRILGLRNQALEQGKEIRKTIHKSLGRVFTKIIAYHWKMKISAEEGQLIIPGKEYNKLVEKRNKALKKQETFIITPAYKLLGELLGISLHKVRYGVKAFSEAFRAFYETGKMPEMKRRRKKAA